MQPTLQKHLLNHEQVQDIARCGSDVGSVHFWRRFTTTIGSADSPFASAMARP